MRMSIVGQCDIFQLWSSSRIPKDAIADVAETKVQWSSHFQYGSWVLKKCYEPCLMYIYGIQCDLMPKICLCLMPKRHMIDKTLSEENQREWHREGKAIYMRSLFKYLNSQGLFESYLTFTRLDFTCIRCIAVSEEIIPNKVNHGGSPTIYFALPPFLNSSSKWGRVGRLGWWLTEILSILAIPVSLPIINVCVGCWLTSDDW